MKRWKILKARETRRRDNETKRSVDETDKQYWYREMVDQQVPLWYLRCTPYGQAG